MDRNPMFTVEHGGQRITVLGTAHISRASAKKVRELLTTGKFDAVAVELGAVRYKKITDPDALSNTDLLQVVKDGKTSMVAANLALSAFQQRTADQFGIKPGEEMRAAIEEATKAGYPVLLIDRDVGITLKRIYRNTPFRRRLRLLMGLLLSVVSQRKVCEEDIERLKEGDILETAFTQFAEKEHDLYVPLINERDRYMSARLLQEVARKEHQHIVAIVGAGHFKGIQQHLSRNPQPSATELEDELADLERLPPTERWLKVLPWLVTGLILAGFAVGFSRNTSLGWQLVLNWVLINGGLSALGAMLATAHPLTIVTAFVAAPITSLNPMIGAGLVTAVTEIWLRRPNVGDFDRLRHDTTQLRGWWRNRVSRVLLVFMFSTIGSAIGTYIAGLHIFNRLM